MIPLFASVNKDKRKQMLLNFDTAADNEVIVISSCETIGEGIDTKNANMCVFVDPKLNLRKDGQNKTILGILLQKKKEVK
tara:strand:+ start:1056 stop:1295 length:240 start_codon:yes stop_codon:yes gene_type:complete